MIKSPAEVRAWRRASAAFVLWLVGGSVAAVEGSASDPVEPAAPAPALTEPQQSTESASSQALDSFGALIAADRNARPIADDDERLLDAEEILFRADEDIYARTHVGFAILGDAVAPGTFQQLGMEAGQTFSGQSVITPVLVAHGSRPGPVLCLTAAVHGDELNGVEVVRQVLYGIKPAELAGTVVGIPIVNLLGFARSSRYLPDRRDLNRYFPGNQHGSAASRLAHQVYQGVIRHCSSLVDLHTGSMNRTNLPQLRADLRIPEVLEFTRGFGATPVMQSDGPKGSLRRAATDRGIPSVTFEIGEPNRLDTEEVQMGVRAVQTLMNKLGMTQRQRRWRETQPVFYDSTWVRTPVGGILIAAVGLGDTVRARQVLGRVVDPISNQSTDLSAPVNGRVLGMALNQVVLPGFAAYHLGIETSAEAAAQHALLAPSGPEEDRRGDDGAPDGARSDDTEID